MIGSYFCINLLVGVIFYHFTLAQKDQKTKNSIFLTQSQRKWLNIQKMVAKAMPDLITMRKSQSRLVLIFYKLAKNKMFEIFMNLGKKRLII